jgi:hypothetical protein
LKKEIKKQKKKSKDLEDFEEKKFNFFPLVIQVDII